MSRDEDIKQYSNWTGAEYVEMQADGTFQKVKLSSEGRQQRIQELGQKYVDELRHALQMKADDIQCSCADKEVLAWVESQFTPDEWAKVNLSFWGIPKPTVTKKAV